MFFIYDMIRFLTVLGKLKLDNIASMKSHEMESIDFFISILIIIHPPLDFELFIECIIS